MIADVAHNLCTPITAFDEMEWDEVLQWHDEARRVAGQKKRT